MKKTTTKRTTTKPKTKKQPAPKKPSSTEDHAGTVIAETRTRAGLTQVELAKHWGRGQNRASAVEKSDNLTFKTMCEVLRAMKTEKAPLGYEFPPPRPIRAEKKAETAS
jgi:ribosome-binding protein aMBF1 (putative translation factor)